MRKVCIIGGDTRLKSVKHSLENQNFFVSTLGLYPDDKADISISPKIAVIESAQDAKVLAERHPEVEVFCGEEGLVTAATADCDMVLNSLMGMRGLVPTYAAIKAGKDIALANKETLVAGGELVMEAVKETGVKMLPVDSEHSAIFQCLQGNEDKEIKRILLTASGGPSMREVR